MRKIGKLVGSRIREIRRSKGLTQEDTAERADINAIYYGRIERGEANVSLDLLAAIAEALGVVLVDLVSVEQPRPSDEMAEEIISAVRALSDQKMRRLYRIYPVLFLTDSDKG